MPLRVLIHEPCDPRSGDVFTSTIYTSTKSMAMRVNFGLHYHHTKGLILTTLIPLYAHLKIWHRQLSSIIYMISLHTTGYIIFNEQMLRNAWNSVAVQEGDFGNLKNDSETI